MRTLRKIRENAPAPPKPKKPVRVASMRYKLPHGWEWRRLKRHGWTAYHKIGEFAWLRVQLVPLTGHDDGWEIHIDGPEYVMHVAPIEAVMAVLERNGQLPV